MVEQQSAASKPSTRRFHFHMVQRVIEEVATMKITARIDLNEPQDQPQEAKKLVSNATVLPCQLSAPAVRLDAAADHRLG